jgi:glycosyltransferase involved in cell wall biosynthesis
MSKQLPLVTVLMPVYNAEQYVGAAIESILTQTYPHFEFLIINDGSKDKSDKIIKSFSDSRIKYLKGSKNKGLDVILNEGFARAEGKYIARMDADDISLPNRLIKQVEFLEQFPEYGMVGSLYADMDSKRKITKIGGLLTDFEDIKMGINFINTFCHGAVMFRKSTLKDHKLAYNSSFKPYEDYELWTRIVNFTKVANLPEVLYLYMNNPAGMFISQNKAMLLGISTLSTKLQNEMSLPVINSKFLKKLYSRSKIYRDSQISLEKSKFISNLTLAYQAYIFGLGKLYIRRGNLKGFLLILLSLYLKPINWIKKLL